MGRRLVWRRGRGEEKEEKESKRKRRRRNLRRGWLTGIGGVEVVEGAYPSLPLRRTASESQARAARERQWSSCVREEQSFVPASPRSGTLATAGPAPASGSPVQQRVVLPSPLALHFASAGVFSRETVGGRSESVP